MKDLFKKKCIISFSHTDYLSNLAGTEKVILEQQQYYNLEGYTYIHIFPNMKKYKICNHYIYIKRNSFGINVDGKFLAYVNIHKLKKIFMDHQNLEKVIIHNLIGYKFNKSLIDLFDLLNCKITYYIHDYATICSNHTLLKNNSTYCGDTGLNFKKCYNCRFYTKSLINRHFYKKFFERNYDIEFIFPSVVARDIWLNTYGHRFSNKCIIKPHQIFSNEIYEYKYKKKICGKINIAYIGYQSKNKGWNAWKNLCRILPDKYNKFVLGKCSEDIENVKVVPVSFIEEGEDAMVNSIRRNSIDIAFLWSTWPETYSYTFFESYIGGAFIITNKNSGNICKMVKDLNCGLVFSNEEELNMSILNGTMEAALEEFYKNRVYRPKKLLSNHVIRE